jgi:hypothetical protein
MSKDPSQNPAEKNDYLLTDHRKTDTTVSDSSNSGVKPSNGAKRIAKYRQQKKERGLAPFDLPITVVEEIKAAGSFEVWIKQFYRIPKDQIKLIRHAIRVEKKVSKLPGWIQWLIIKL